MSQQNAITREEFQRYDEKNTKTVETLFTKLDKQTEILHKIELSLAEGNVPELKKNCPISQKTSKTGKSARSAGPFWFLVVVLLLWISL